MRPKLTDSRVPPSNYYGQNHTLFRSSSPWSKSPTSSIRFHLLYLTLTRTCPLKLLYWQARRLGPFSHAPSCRYHVPFYLLCALQHLSSILRPLASISDNHNVSCPLRQWNSAMIRYVYNNRVSQNVCEAAQIRKSRLFGRRKEYPSGPCHLSLTPSRPLVLLYGHLLSLSRSCMSSCHIILAISTYSMKTCPVACTRNISRILFISA